MQELFDRAAEQTRSEYKIFEYDMQCKIFTPISSEVNTGAVSGAEESDDSDDGDDNMGGDTTNTSTTQETVRPDPGCIRL